jgi:hypothetical protein
LAAPRRWFLSLPLSRLFVPVVLIVPLVALVGCGKPDPSGAANGNACAEDTECQSAWCQTDPEFTDGYCSSQCDEENGCLDGSTCQSWRSTDYCLASCAEDTDCRDGYVCDYESCRPPCTTDQVCQSTDKCLQGHCKAACTSDDDCDSTKRCQDGKCVPPCKVDADCLPGYSCDTGTGKCKAKPGKVMGAACTASSQCATGYCLPTRKICSVKCKGSANCPSKYVCGLEKLDTDGNGLYDSAEADCVPVKGTAAAGALCDKDADCASAHCYDGFCMEGCTADSDCGSLQCLQVHLVLGGAIGKYKGCLPKQGVSTMTLGTGLTTGDVGGVDIPSTASSFVLMTSVNSTTEVGAVEKILDPNNTLVSEVADLCDYYSVPNRYTPDEQIASLFVPITPSVKLVPGVYTYTVGASDWSLPITVKLRLKLGTAQKGSFAINWIFADLSSTCISGTLKASTAASNTWMTKLRNNLTSTLKSFGLSITKETYKDLSDSQLDNITLEDSGYSTDLQKILSKSKGTTGSAINIYIVRKITGSVSSGGIILGYSGGIPGPPGVHGTVHSGLLISAQSACFEQYGYNTTYTVAHEMGHFLGLFHNEETETYPGYINNKVTCACPCGQYQSCYNSQWCRGEDPISDTDTSSSNLMYYAAESGQTFKGNLLTSGQIRVILNNPLVGH